MSRSIVLLSFILFLSCDTSNSVEPRFNNFFVKIIGIEGNQYGNDVIQSADGGYIIAGKTQIRDGEIAYFSVIKTDSIGNTQWFYPPVPNSGIEGEAVSVVEIADGSIIVGGTRMFNNTSRSIILKLGSSGNFEKSKEFITNEGNIDYLNSLSKITISASDTILISGDTNQPRTPGNVTNPNGYFGLLDFDLNRLEFSGADSIQIVGLDDDSDHLTGAFRTSYPNDFKYVVLGYSDVKGDDDFFYEFYKDEAGPPSAVGYFIAANDQRSKGVTEYQSNFYLIGTNYLLPNFQAVTGKVTIKDTDSQDDIAEESLNYLPLNDQAFGKSLALQGTNEYIFNVDVGFVDVDDEINRSTILGLNGATFNFVDWSKTFGVEGRNYANTVIIDRSGSVVTVGTLDLESQFKVVLIKTGPNGEMSF